MSKSKQTIDVLKVRKALGLNQEEFAKKLGCSKWTVWNWENGKSRPHRLYQKELRKMREEL